MIFLNGILWSIIVGGIAGWLAGLILRGESFGVLWNIIIGIVGGALANVIMGLITIIGIRVTPWSIFGRIIAATLGSILLIMILKRTGYLKVK